MPDDRIIGNCDCCGLPVRDGDLVYSIAKPGPRHAKCNTEKQQKVRKDLDASIERVKGLLGQLRNRT